MQKMQDLGQQDFAAQAVRIMDELQATAPGRSDACLAKSR